MTYFISLIRENGEEWTLYATEDPKEAVNYFRETATPPEYKYKELRQTAEDIDTYINYETILRK